MAGRSAVLLNFTRSFKTAKHPKPWKKDAVKYEKVTYYPRNGDHVDPPITPSKLLMVERVKLFKGNPHYEKDILTHFGLQDKMNNPVILKNTPDICAMLWRVKHLVRITPIKLPEKLPDEKHADTYLHENGTLHVIPKVDPARYKATEDFIYDVKKFDCMTIKDQGRKAWLNGTLM